LFVLRENDHIILLLIYVDDIIITESNNKSLETFITQLNIAFSLKDLGLLQYFLGIEVHKDAGGMYLKQSTLEIYSRSLIWKKSSPWPTPMVTGKQLTGYRCITIFDQHSTRHNIFYQETQPIYEFPNHGSLAMNKKNL